MNEGKRGENKTKEKEEKINEGREGEKERRKKRRE